MALSYTRLLCRQNINFRHFRYLYTCSSLHVATTPPLKATSSPICETFDEKNLRLKRPMSPHLTIYQVQLTALLSITHRATGMILSTYAIFLGFGTLFVPGGIPCIIELINDLALPIPLLFVCKALLALPATYHTCSGIRHLAWDLGLFLTIKQVYTTGYLVVGLAALSALILASL